LPNPPTSPPSPSASKTPPPASGIQFTHTFGARKLGSLLESTGAGCVWFDYNNDGLPDLICGHPARPLGDDIHPYPLRQPPATPPHNHLYRNDGNGKFTDVTDAGLRRRGPLQHGRHRRRFR
jgi:enediyne biosynthesis protein E4